MEPDIRAADCPCCDGTGEVYAGSTSGNWYEPPEPIFERCPECGGSGQALREVEPVELEDTLGALLPEDGKHPQFWPFEPVFEDPR